MRDSRELDNADIGSTTRTNICKKQQFLEVRDNKEESIVASILTSENSVRGSMLASRLQNGFVGIEGSRCFTATKLRGDSAVRTKCPCPYPLESCSDRTETHPVKQQEDDPRTALCN